jgi:hypothetical protein
MPGPEQLVRAAVALPVAIVRTVAGIAWDLLPGTGAAEQPQAQPPVPSPAPRVVPPAPPPVPDIEGDLGGHIETEVEVVAVSADPEAPDPPGPELHVDEPWEGYRRMKVSEIAAQLEGQSAEALAAVELYESTHRNRPGVLEAVRAASRA